MDGELLLKECLRLNGKSLAVSGKVALENSRRLQFQHGSAAVGSVGMKSSSGLYMEYEDDRLDIAGNLQIQSRYNYMNRGSVSVGGDVTFADSPGCKMGEALTVTLNGDQKQTVSMKGAGNSFGTLVIANTSADGI